ncbi:hypothetical protein [Kribbella sindirgiensis]|uniref:Uncharacterized protein n=1 Tax=Kribbella sindirgiensis TaxID=1124744 RepID=A0A4R0IBU4_9ACTN|nr:hypothetical protein [Kribbella sindirgiensis]TCC19992.1 hypothetical protein E0H50_37860 [Kribbella sindirgiensis]
MDDPIPAERAAPGEYFLAAESVHLGLRFFYRDSVYEVVEEPSRLGAAWYANVEIIEGGKPGARFKAMLHTGKRVK